MRVRFLPGACAWLLAGVAWMPVLAFAQQGADVPVEAGGATPRTGDGWVDARLPDIDRYAERHHEAFVDELVRYQAVPRAVAEEALQAGVPAGHLYYACAMAQALGRPCREVLSAWRGGGAGEGWADVARSLDPDRSDAARQRVKRGIVHSYARWARPLALDAALRRAFPDHPRSGR